MPSTKQATTQEFTDIHDINNNLLITNNGAVSLIIQVSAMNFGLLSEEEQDAIIYGYAGLLNSINYPIQIIVHSKTKDITDYLNRLRDIEDNKFSQRKKQLISRYRTFISQLIKERNVLDKKFYITITATPVELGFIDPSNLLTKKQTVDFSNYEITTIIEKAKTILEPRRDHIFTNFGKIGLSCNQLSTQEIIQVFYTNYNPEASEGQQLTNTRSYTTPVIQAQITTNIRKRQNQDIAATHQQLKRSRININSGQQPKVNQSLPPNKTTTLNNQIISNNENAPPPSNSPIQPNQLTAQKTSPQKQAQNQNQSTQPTPNQDLPVQKQQPAQQYNQQQANSNQINRRSVTNQSQTSQQPMQKNNTNSAQQNQRNLTRNNQNTNSNPKNNANINQTGQVFSNQNNQ